MKAEKILQLIDPVSFTVIDEIRVDFGNDAEFGLVGGPEGIDYDRNKDAIIVAVAGQSNPGIAQVDYKPFEANI